VNTQDQGANLNLGLSGLRTIIRKFYNASYKLLERLRIIIIFILMP